jgi:hypothetical protein
VIIQASAVEQCQADAWFTPNLENIEIMEKSGSFKMVREVNEKSVRDIQK